MAEIVWTEPAIADLEAIADYIALENSSHAHYWSEKLADTYLGWSFPFYWGCPNTSDYFPEQSLCQIDRDDLARAIFAATGGASQFAQRVVVEAIKESQAAQADEERVGYRGSEHGQIITTDGTSASGRDGAGTSAIQ